MGAAGRERARSRFEMATNLGQLAACFEEAVETGPPRAIQAV
jgi:hypothetical protein